MLEERHGVETHEVCDDYIMRLAADRLEELTGVDDGRRDAKKVSI